MDAYDFTEFQKFVDERYQRVFERINRYRDEMIENVKQKLMEQSLDYSTIIDGEQDKIVAVDGYLFYHKDNVFSFLGYVNIHINPVFPDTPLKKKYERLIGSFDEYFQQENLGFEDTISLIAEETWAEKFSQISKWDCTDYFDLGTLFDRVDFPFWFI
jgi:hypothetical protein